MVYLTGFSIPNGGVIDDYDYPTAYPFGIFEHMDIDYFQFRNITILYGGNGSGKSTLLRLIADKCGLKHRTTVDQTEHYWKFLKRCDVSYEDELRQNALPVGSKIITSEDIMDRILQLRVLNEDIGKKRDQSEQEYWEKKYVPHQLTSMDEFEEFRMRNRIKKLSKTKFLNANGGVRKREYSNGENVMRYFEEELDFGKVYFLDEPEVSLSTRYQLELAEKILEMGRFSDCQFIIATHSPFILGIEDALIYNLDKYPVDTCRFEKLENMQLYFDFFNKFKDRF